MKIQLHKIGAGLYVVWGLMHLPAAYKVYRLGGTMSDEMAMIRGRVVQDAWNLGWIAVLAVFVAVRLNWRNDRTGYWLNLSVVSLTDIGFIVAILVPGHLPPAQGLLGPVVWLLAVIFSTLGLVLEEKAAQQIPVV